MRGQARMGACAAVVVLAAVGCIIVGGTRPERVLLNRPVTVQTPVKVHLRDGSVVVLRYGATVTRDSVVGVGIRYSPALSDSGLFRSVGIDSVIGVETFTYSTDAATTFVASMIAVPLFKIAFGSCPTIYSDSAGEPVLESEAFSYSIAPLLAKRDVDRLRARADTSGLVRLEVRNEALETHYIDHFELLEVRHPRGWTARPAAYGSPITVPSFSPPSSARDRAGRNVLGDIIDTDRDAFATDSATLANATDADIEDWIELELPVASKTDSIALALRMRSSLLTTVLFYDYMLARAGARSLDWLGQDLTRITTMASLARWYTSKLGLHVEVQDGSRFRKVARLVDFGPIAWREIALVVPTLGRDTVRVRLRFVADEWRIDRVSYAERFERENVRSIAVTRVIDDRGAARDTARLALRKADASYVTTAPGARFFLEFETGRMSGTGDRSFLIAEHGYYTEWIRGDWIRNATDSVTFDPKRVRLSEVLSSWRQVKDSLETAFFLYKVPVT